MRNMLIAAIAGLTVCLAGDFTSQAEAHSWRRGYRQFQRQYRHFDRWDRRYNRGYHGRYYAPRRYYSPRRYYYTPRYHYGYGYPSYGWHRGGVWFRF